MQHILRNLPEHLDRAIRNRARQENKSVNEVTIEALLRAFGMQGEAAAQQRDLSRIAGTWVDDPQQTTALADQRRIDPELWR